jgi:hypothetical protein
VSDGHLVSNPPEDEGEVEKRSRLLERIEERRKEISIFIARNKGKRSRLARVSMVFSTVSAALTVGPGAGGDSFVDSVKDSLGLSASSEVWRFLCLVSVLVSALAVYSAGLLNSSKLDEDITAAQAANFEMDGLVTMLEFDGIDIDAAVTLYREYSSRIKFVWE